MAQQSFPFENIDTTEAQFSKWARNFQETGIQGSPLGTELTVSAEGSTLNVDVSAGQAFIRGHYYINTSSLTLPITSAGLNTRIDYVVLELDPTANTIVAKIISGTAVSSNPVAPTLTQTEDGIYQLPIAIIEIPNSTLAITSEMITDVRTFMGNRVGVWTTDTRPESPVDYQTLGYNTTIGYHEYWNGSAWIPFVPPADSPNFVIEITGTNTVTNFTFPKQAGPYSISLASGDATFDVYLLDSLGDVIAYSNTASITADEEFFGVAIIGVASGEKVTFLFTGEIVDATGAGTATKAGAYVTSITPSTLPDINDTGTVVGGNFATDVQVFFESGATSLPAKNIVRNSSTELIVTRPDGLVQDLSPYDLRVNNPGTQPPVGSNAHILVDGVSAGTDPTFVTTSPILGAFPSVPFSGAIVTSDDTSVVLWEVISGTFPAGLTLNSTTGAITGTPTTRQDYNFTIRITDAGGNTATRAYNLPVGTFIEAATVSGGFQYRMISASSNLNIKNPHPTNVVEYAIVAGGGGGGGGNQGPGTAGAGGGAGGVLTGSVAMPLSSYACVIGAGGGLGYATINGGNGSNSAITALSLTATGGGGGQTSGTSTVQNGGSGGGAANNTGSGGTGIAGQGNNGGSYTSTNGGGGAGGGGRGAIGGTNRSSNLGGIGGAGTNTISTWLTVFGYTTSGFIAGGGGGGSTQYETTRTNVGGSGGGGAGGSRTGTSSSPAHFPDSGMTNTGGGGGGGANSSFGGDYGANGGSGVVMVRMAV